MGCGLESLKIKAKDAILETPRLLKASEGILGLEFRASRVLSRGFLDGLFRYPKP